MAGGRWGRTSAVRRRLRTGFLLQWGIHRFSRTVAARLALGALAHVRTASPSCEARGATRCRPLPAFPAASMHPLRMSRLALAAPAIALLLACSDSTDPGASDPLDVT